MDNEQTFLEIRVGKYDGDLEDLCRKYSLNFTPNPHTQRREMDEHVLFLTRYSRNYCLSVSLGGDNPEYNLAIQVVGPNEGVVKQIMLEFQKSIAIETKPLSADIQEQVNKQKRDFEQSHRR